MLVAQNYGCTKFTLKWLDGMGLMLADSQWWSYFSTMVMSDHLHLRFPGLSSPPRVWALALWPPAHTYLSSASPASAFSSDLGRTHSGCGLVLGTERGDEG